MANQLLLAIIMVYHIVQLLLVMIVILSLLFIGLAIIANPSPVRCFVDRGDRPDGRAPLGFRPGKGIAAAAGTSRCGLRMRPMVGLNGGVKPVVHMVLP